MKKSAFILVAGFLLFFAASGMTYAATTSTPPQSLAATSTNASVSLSWTAPSSDGSSTLTQYDVLDRFTGLSTFAEVATTTPSITTSTLTGLTNGQSYDFAIVAENGVGSSSLSNIVSSTPFTVPGAPTGISAVVGPLQATVTTIASSSPEVCSPKGGAVDSAGNYYYSNWECAYIGETTASGTAKNIAGNGSYGYVNGPTSTAEFNNSSGVAVDGAGNVYVADTMNCVIRKIDVSTGQVSTYAGNGVCSEVDGPTSTAEFDNPAGLGVDAAGNLYETSYIGCTVRKITPAGVVTTIAGKYDDCAEVDGAGSTARFNNPSGVVADAYGNLFVADETGCTIRKIAPDGMVTTLAGSPDNCGAADGTGSSARFYVPSWVGVDAHDNVYATDFMNYSVRMITPRGAVTTIAGLLGTSGAVDGTGQAARFYRPDGIAVDSAGDIWVSDRFNNLIRKLVLNPVPSINVMFAAPLSNGGSTITGYDVVSSPSGGVDGDALGTALTHAVSNLSGSTPYTFTVAAYNAAGESAPSAASNSVIPVLSATYPTNPRSLVTTSGNGVVFLSWLAPSSNGSSSITQYDVLDRLTGGPMFTEVATTSPSQTDSLISGLTNGQSYDFDVVAENGIGNSLPSAAASSTPTSNGTVYYLASGGSDTNSGTTSTAPLATFAALMSDRQAVVSEGPVTSTDRIQFAANVRISLSSGGVIDVPASTSMTTSGVSDFTQLLATTTVNVADLPANYTTQGALAFGLPSFSVSLSQPVTISLPVSSSNGTSLTVYMQEPGSSSWTNLTSCTVANGLCTFTTSNLSTFVAASYTPPSTSPSTSGGSPVTGGGGGSAYDLLIDGGSSTTPNPEVTLSLYGTEAYTMQVSTDPTFTGSSWIPYVTSLPYALSAASTPQTIYVRFRAISGTIVGSAQASIQLVSATGGTTTTVSSSTASLLAELRSLEAELASLEAHVQGTSSSTAPSVFSRNLSLWSRGADVLALQVYLNAHGFSVASTGPGSPGHETDLFGPKTKDALIKFQAAHGIPATGFFGPITRGWIEGK